MDIAIACGVYPTTVGRWEERGIPRNHVVMVARMLGVSVPYLDGWIDDPGHNDKPLAEAS